MKTRLASWILFIPLFSAWAQPSLAQAVANKVTAHWD
jgi:hypothetical protein